VELRDHSVLIVEDEFFTAIELEAIVRNAGAEVIGPALSAPEALLLIDNHKITVAILDVWLNQRNSLPVAQRLADLGIPFVFIPGTGATPFLTATGRASRCSRSRSLPAPSQQRWPRWQGADSLAFTLAFQGRRVEGVRRSLDF
jgi:CheY-like chemotaxis protein